MANASKATKPHSDAVLPLPDFCSLQVQFRAILTAQLVAAILAVARSTSTNAWLDLAFVSIFSLLLVIIWSIAMCQLNKLRSNWSVPTLYTTGFGFALLIAFFLGLIAWEISELLGYATGSASLGEFLARILAIVAAASGLALRYLYIDYEARREMAGQAQARIDALQARIRPHFLFNTLNTIADLIAVDARAAEDAVQDLADLYRANLAATGRFISLEDEFNICRQYLGIEQYRLGDRLQVNWELGDLPWQAKLPCLTLQPLIENAVYHGVEPRPEGGSITIEASTKDDLVTIRITNPVGGEARRSSGYQVAWENTRQRLRLAFPESGTLNAGNDAGSYWVEVQFDPGGVTI